MARGGHVLSPVVPVLASWRRELEGCAPLFWLVAIGLVGCTLWALAGCAGRTTARRRSSGAGVGGGVGAVRGPQRVAVVPASRAMAVAAIGFAVAWVLVDKRAEGPVLLIVTQGHGVTVSDLASVVAVAIGGWRLALP